LKSKLEKKKKKKTRRTRKRDCKTRNLGGGAMQALRRKRKGRVCREGTVAVPLEGSPTRNGKKRGFAQSRGEKKRRTEVRGKVGKRTHVPRKREREAVIVRYGKNAITGKKKEGGRGGEGGGGGNRRLF